MSMAKRELTDAQTFAKFDHDGDGRAGGSLPKGERKMAKASTKRTTARKTQVQKRGDQAPEAKRTKAAQSDAAEKLFKDADEAAPRGLPPDMTKDQHETMVRKAALGY